jgi:4-amino-4-deoxy-L-arabinose transferase-like glycosyltransferase
MTISTVGYPKKLLPRLLDALSDPARREVVAAIALAAYALVWTLYGTIAKSSQDIHFDMGEMVAWSREVTFGTPKHPPFGAWLVRLWFSVFPAADWAYYLFAIVLATLALWMAWKISGQYLDAQKRVVGLALLTLVPFFNFHALKFNANTVMVPLWAATTWFFLRSFETRNSTWAALAGLAAAAAVLGKYWSIILLAALAITAVVHPRRGAYFRSPAPYVTALVSMIAFAPHLVWLYGNHFNEFGYALASHPATWWTVIGSCFSYVVGALAYLVVPTLIIVLLGRPNRAAIVDTLWPLDPDRRQALLAFALPLLLPALAALATHEEVISLWAMGSMTLFPVVLLSSPRLVLPRPASEIILGIAVAFPLLALAGAPAIAIVIHQRGVPNYATQYRLVAGAIEQAWHAATDRPLRIVGSYETLMNGVIFYLPERPTTFEIISPDLTPWVDDARIAREGIVLACPSAESLCMRALEARVTRSNGSKRTETDIARSYFGIPGKPQHYVIVAIPPRS